MCEDMATKQLATHRLVCNPSLVSGSTNGKEVSADLDLQCKSVYLAMLHEVTSPCSK